MTMAIRYGMSPEQLAQLEQQEKEKRFRILKFGLGGFAAFLVLITASCGITIVNTGHRGVKLTFSEVRGEGLSEGLYFVNPLTTTIKEMDARILKWQSSTQAYTKDVQQAEVEFVVNYRLDPTKAHIMYQQVGMDWGEKLVGQVVHEDIKREFGQHIAVDIIANRDAAARSIESNVRTQLANRNVIVTNLQITNIDYTEKFEHAVEAKVIAEQEAIREKNKTVQIEEQAKQKVATAKGEAEAKILNAEAEAKSIRIRGQALEENQRLVELVTAERWDGKLPTYTLGNAIPFINVPAGEKK
jgi:regulator of protease activity HflC (stomatin/prohibitin superfamily)